MADPTRTGLSEFYRAAARGAAVAVVLIAGIEASLLNTGYGNVPEFVAGAVFGIAAVAAFTVLTAGLLALIGQLPRRPAALFAGAISGLVLVVAVTPAALLRTVLDPGSWSLPAFPPASLSPLALMQLVLALAGISGLMRILSSGDYAALGRGPRTWILGVSLVFLSLGALVVYDLARDGKDPYPTDYRLEGGTGAISLSDPSEPGSFRTEALSYGSGENLRRPEFAAERDLESRSVDASALLPEWKEFKKRMRESYWGFGLTEAPLNGLLWTPLGNGPFPLVLIVHGNHGMEDYSDGGYAYLGELLASRGFIVVSVDQNYINGTWSGDFRGKEMPARAWLLLQHLALWRDWNEDPESRFYRAVDMDAVALIGHSRGGEAVSIAYAYNDLGHFPDDATVPFDFGFGIKSLVAIAQIDQRYHRRVELENVNFFTIHGSYDSDEPAYHGIRQFNRIQFNDDRYWLKAGIYLHGANHGQFNTGWGRSDFAAPGSWLLNHAPIMRPGDQRQAAMVFISAFLEATLRDNRGYLALLRNPQNASAWLPRQAYVQQFVDSTFRAIATFEEDLDVSTATAAGARISSNALGLWREEDLEHRDERRQGSNAVVIGWNRDAAGDASYSMVLEDPDARQMLAANRALTFSVSSSMEVPPDSSDSNDRLDEEREATAPAFRIELIDAAGHVASARSDEYSNLAPPFRIRFLKNTPLNDRSYNSDWEPVLQYFELPLGKLAAENPAFDLGSTREIRFRFDQAPEGVIILDDIGVSDIG